ncbi:MAG: PLP-dependent aminotransferase family protein [Ardenticatenaceae bacterium]
MTSFDHLLSHRTQRMGVNVIREILKVVNQPGMVSLAGGIPAPESFPMDIFGELTSQVLDKYGSTALQYDVSEGFQPLREALVDYLTQERQVVTTFDDILVFSGSQSVLDTVGKILISPGDGVVIESPSYLGAISAFNAYEPRYFSVATDEHGLIPEALEQILTQQQVKFIYLTPTFQNPTGRTLTLERRQQVAEIIKRHNTVVLEDDPYGALRYSGEPLPPIQQFAPNHVIYASTFSKILSPGLRVGFCAVPTTLRKWLVVAKQAADLHTSTFSQAVAAEYLQGHYLKKQLPKIINLYRPRRDTMLAALDRYFPANFTWTEPDGGMFLWLEGPEGLDAEALYWQCIEEKVAFVPGKYFFTDHQTEGLATMRFNFTKADEKTIAMAVKTIGDVAKRYG